MHKALFTVLLVAVSALCSQAQSTQKQLRFHYYPTVNVYYNEAANLFIYKNGNSWRTSKSLPIKANLNGAPKMIVLHPNPKVWENNKMHLARYKIMKSHQARGIYNFKKLSTEKQK